MLVTGRDDRRGANGRDKSGRNGAKNGRTGAGSRFEVLGRAGEGMLWIVYRVRERTTGEVLALKALKGAFNRHPRFPLALQGSCTRYCGLQDHNLAAPHEVGREDETLFFTSEWLPGGSLETRLNRALSREDILAVVRSAASALQFLHEMGLTHGDVRPRQFLFDAAGHLKLTDVGVADAFANAGLALADVQPDAAWYLAPERTQGASLAPPADIYALGVLLYRMLAGRVPFDGPSPVAIALRHRSDAPLPPSQFNPRCPADLEQLALRLLEKDPERRLGAGGLLRLLDQIAPETRAASAAAPITSGSSATVAPVPVAPAVITPAVIAPAVMAPAAAPVAAQVADLPVSAPPSPVVTKKTSRKPEDPPLDRETQRRRHRRREFWGAFSAFIFLLIFMGAFAGMIYGAYYYWMQETPQQVRVPNYLGMNQEDAVNALAKSGLTMKVVRETFDAKKPAGTVVAGQPEPGRLVRARREVTVTVSQGEAPITMYDFSELPLDQARQIIAQHAMRLGPVVQQFHDKVPAGFICGQYPEAGESFHRSDPITLIVSRGPQPSVIDGTDSNAVTTPSTTIPSQTLPVDQVPLDAKGQPDLNAAISRTALIKVQIPEDGGSQLVRVVISDAGGQRTVYSKTHHAGDEIEQRVHVRRAQGATAIVRVYVGDSLIKEERL